MCNSVLHCLIVLIDGEPGRPREPASHVQGYRNRWQEAGSARHHFIARTMHGPGAGMSSGIILPDLR
jgi:hypothetical protein